MVGWNADRMPGMDGQDDKVNDQVSDKASQNRQDLLWM
jgi:hypothetical protein